MQESASSYASSSLSETNIPIAYGVDWTDQAHPLSHCWFPYNPTDPSSAPACSFFSCQNPKPTLFLSLVQCESCLIVVHVHHLTNLRITKSNITNYLPSCRPSFYDDNENDEPIKLDRHFWSTVPILAKPCTFCKRKSVSTSFFGNSRASAMPTLDLMSKSLNNSKSQLPGSPKLSCLGAGLLCLWCSRGYHRQCWEHISNQDDKTKCDYGVFRYNDRKPYKKKDYDLMFPLFILMIILEILLFDHNGYIAYRILFLIFVLNILPKLNKTQSIHH